MSKNYKKITSTSMRSKLAKYKEIAGLYINIGFDSTPHKEMDGNVRITNAQLAYLQEVGDFSIGLPPRPFLVKAFKFVNGRKRIVDTFKRTKNKRTIQSVLGHIRTEMIEYVEDGYVSPALTPNTLGRKFAKSKKYGVKFTTSPLYETGNLIRGLKTWWSN